MKTILTIGLSFVIWGTAYCGAQTESAATNRESSDGKSSPHIRAEDLGHDFFNGKTNKIARVIEATPTHVRVRYENGGQRNIPRLELNSPLKERYPHDVQAAADYVQKQTLSAQA
jgi:hypothetical protein